MELELILHCFQMLDWSQLAEYHQTKPVEDTLSQRWPQDLRYNIRSTEQSYPMLGHYNLWLPPCAESGIHLYLPVCRLFDQDLPIHAYLHPYTKLDYLDQVSYNENYLALVIETPRQILANQRVLQ